VHGKGSDDPEWLDSWSCRRRKLGLKDWGTGE
jgi:hypothetical protein